jgi:hypothetical protein
MKRCYIAGLNRAFNLFNSDFQGRIENCTLDAKLEGGSNHAIIVEGTTGNINIGSMVNCSLIGDIAGDPVIIEVADDSEMHLIGCMFDETKVSMSGGQLISHLHNNSNNTQVFIASNLLVDSSTYNVPNSDSIDWFSTTAEWKINGSFEFESKAASTPSAGLRSIFIPIATSTDMYVEFKGSIGISGTQYRARIYDISQTTVLSEIDKTGFSEASGIHSGTVTGHASAAFLQLEFESSAGGETLSNIHVREVNSTGNLVFNEDGANHYAMIGTNMDYDASESHLRFNGSFNTDLLILGDIDMNATDTTLDVKGSNGNDFAHIFAYQGGVDYYYLMLDDTPADSNTVRLFKRDSGGSTELASATNTSTGNPIDFGGVNDIVKVRVRWNDPNIVSYVSGAIQVYIDDVLIQSNTSGGWSTGGALDFIVDSTYTVGRAGFTGSGGVELVDYTVKHHGFFLRDVDLLLDTGVTITLGANNLWDFERGTVNATLASFIDAGFTFNEVDVTWEGGGFVDNTTILSTRTWRCSNFTLSSDIIMGVNGSLAIIGSEVKSVDPKDWYTIKTEGSIIFPPLQMSGAVLLNLNPRFRPLNPADGSPLLVDHDKRNTGPSRTVLLPDTPEEDRELLIIKNQPYGRKYARSVVKGQTSGRVTLHFLEYHAHCVLGTFQEFKKNEVLFEAIWNTGYMPKARVKNIAVGRLHAGGTRREFRVMLEEMR